MQRKLAVCIGSESDLPQCIPGLEYLESMEKLGHIIFRDNFFVGSIHRHFKFDLHELVPKLIAQRVDAILCAAGMAAQLPAILDTILRREYGVNNIVVYGVGFMSPYQFAQHLQGREVKRALWDEASEAALLSISQVPGNLVQHSKTQIGPDQFLEACRQACEDPLPDLVASDPPPPRVWTLTQALEEAHKKMAKFKEEFNIP